MAKLLVAAGGLLQLSCGEMFPPVQPKPENSIVFGICLPSCTVVLVTVNGAAWAAPAPTSIITTNQKIVFIITPLPCFIGGDFFVKETLAMYQEDNEKTEEYNDTHYKNIRSRGLSHEDESLAVHVAVCAERYKGINDRLEKIERALWWMVTTLIIALGGMVFQLIFFFVKG
jgi:hypothetical protein